MTDLYQCPDCGREYRADKLSMCPGCGEANHNATATQASRTNARTWGEADQFEPLSKIRASRAKPEFDRESVISTLFTDRYFRRFITRTWAGNIAVIGVWAIAIGGLITFIGLVLGLPQYPELFLGWVISLVVTPFATISAIVLWRVAVEILVSVVIIAENTEPAEK